MAYSDRELLARIIQCEAGGEGDTGMRAVASVIMNRVNVADGEYARVSQGGSIRNIIYQTGQFTCVSETVGGKYNSQNIYNMNPTDVEYSIADWAIAGNKISQAGNCLWYMNPYRPTCPGTFPYNGTGTLHTKINKHCFYRPTNRYRNS